VPAWLEDAGERDITAHVDFTSVRIAAEAEGMTTLGFLDQTYFLMGLGAVTADAGDLKRRLALKTLLMPGGLGSTHKVLILGKGVGTPKLAGCSFRVRVT
jgi:SAM-dependent MidA family methyltransferase